MKVNDYTIRVVREITVQATSPKNAIEETAHLAEEDWPLMEYTVECEQCDETWDNEPDAYACSVHVCANTYELIWRTNCRDFIDGEQK